MDRPRCIECVFWTEMSDQIGDCRVDGPQIVTGGTGNYGQWPWTSPGAWCGKHRAIKPKKPAEKPVTL